MKSQFVNLILRPVRPEPAASHMFVVGQQKYRPVLKTVGVHPVDLALQSFPKARAPQPGLASPTTGTQAAPSSENKTRRACFSSQCLLPVCRNISPRPMHALDICADRAQLLNNPLIPE